MSYRDGETYYSLTFEIDELRDICNKAKRKDEEYVDLKFNYTKAEVMDLLAEFPLDDTIEIVWNAVADLDWSESWAEGFRDAGYEACWEKMADFEKRDNLEEGIANLPEGSKGFCEEWIKESFQPFRPSDEMDFRHFIEDCGFGHLLKGEK